MPVSKKINEKGKSKSGWWKAAWYAGMFVVNLFAAFILMIEKYSYYILSDIIQEGSEEFAAKMVETGLVSNDILQKMLPKAENAEMLTLKAYMLNQLNLNGAQEEKISYSI